MKSEKDLKILEENIDGCSKVHEIPGIEGSLCGVKRVSFIDPVCGFLVEAVSGRSIEVLTSARDQIIQLWK